MGVAIRAPPSGPAPHLLLTLAHYAYFFHSPPLAIAAIHLLAAIAGLIDGGGAAAVDDETAASAPPLVSVLACLSAAAPAVKELLVARLESPLEDIRVKVAILELVAACIDQQPGMTQLLLDISPGINLVVESSATPARLAGKNPRPRCRLCFFSPCVSARAMPLTPAPSLPPSRCWLVLVGRKYLLKRGDEKY